ncbi:MAG TPA: YfiR family protein [Verrucomicrobiae bacterium]
MAMNHAAIKKICRAIRSGAWIVLLLLAAGPGIAPGAARAGTEISKEYQVKAVFLFNFAQFVEWPTNAFPETQTPLVIGILGDDPFGAFLDETVRGETVNTRPLVIRRFRRVEDIKMCHILFISQSEAKRLDRIFTDLKDRNILTVGDSENFASRGGMIRFNIEQNKIQLRINLEAAKAANLTISSKLLRPAVIVAPGKD